MSSLKRSLYIFDRCFYWLCHSFIRALCVTVTAWSENCQFCFWATEVIGKLPWAEDAFRRTFGLDGVCWEVGTRQSLLFDFANNATDCWSITELFKGLKLCDKKIVIFVQNRCRELVLVVRCSTRLSSYIYRVYFNYSTRFSEPKRLFDFFQEILHLKNLLAGWARLFSCWSWKWGGTI